MHDGRGPRRIEEWPEMPLGVLARPYKHLTDSAPT